MPETIEVEVFRAGDYGPKGRWGEEELERLAADYDPALHEAPVTVDHAQAGPALGWVEAVRRVGDRLVARLRLTSARLMELIRGEGFKKRSVEIYPALRETGRPYLRAVSFLGAAAPEVKGLADPALEGVAEPAPLFNEDEPAHEAFELAAAEPEGAEAGERRPEAARWFTELAGRLRREGRWDPAWGELGIEPFCAALAELDEIELGGRRVRPADWFGEFLGRLRPLVMMGEAAPPLGEELLIPNDPQVSADSIALHRRAVAFQAEHPGLCYAEALARVS